MKKDIYKTQDIPKFQYIGKKPLGTMEKVEIKKSIQDGINELTKQMEKIDEIQKVEVINHQKQEEISFPDIQKVRLINPPKDPEPVIFPKEQTVVVKNQVVVPPPADLRNVEKLLTSLVQKQYPVTKDVRILNPTPPLDIPIGEGNIPGKTDPTRYIPVRLTNGSKFYSAIQDAFVAAAKTSYPFVNYRTGKPQAAAVDNDGTIRTDLVIDTINVTVSGTTTSGTPGYTFITNIPTIQTINAANNLTLTCSGITAAVNGDNIVIPAVNGKSICVYAWNFSFSGTVNAKFTDGLSGRLLNGLYYGIQNAGGGNAVVPPYFLFQTSTSNPLVINLSGATAIGGSVSYFLQ